MQNNGIVKEAKYLNYVSELIFNYKFNSLFKITILCLILYYGDDSIKNMRGKYNLNDILFKNLKSIIFANYSDFEFVFKSISLLKQNNLIKVQNDSIFIINKPSHKIPNQVLSKALKECLNNICLMTQKSFLFEVLDNV